VTNKSKQVKTSQTSQKVTAAAAKPGRSAGSSTQSRHSHTPWGGSKAGSMRGQHKPTKALQHPQLPAKAAANMSFVPRVKSSPALLQQSDVRDVTHTLCCSKARSMRC
jgi:hypothetical protein